MAQKHKPGLAVIIGVGKPAGPKGPMPPRPGAQSAPAPKEPGEAQAPDEDQREQSGQKASQEEASCYYGPERCSNCDHYIPASHECKVVEGNNFGTDVIGCVRYFEPIGQEATEGEPGPGGPAPTDVGPAPAGPQGQ